MDVVLLWTLSTNCQKIGRRSAIPERQHWKFIGRIVETWDRWSTMSINRWSMTIGSMSNTLHLTSIAHHHPTSSTCTHLADRFNHELFYRSRHWRAVVTDCHCWWWHNHTTRHLYIVIRTTIQEATRNPSYPMHKQLCSTHVTNNSESGIFRLRKGVMLRSFTISSYHNGLLFHFNIVYLATCSLHHFCAFLLFSLVIVHCTIHVFQISWLIVYATHSSYLCSCTYISRDPSSSIDSF